MASQVPASEIIKTRVRSRILREASMGSMGPSSISESVDFSKSQLILAGTFSKATGWTAMR
jgi:hypothetical protein